MAEKILVTITYEKEIEDRDYDLQRFQACIGDDPAFRERIATLVTESWGARTISCSTEKSRKLEAVQKRIEEVTSNSGEKTFPDDVIAFLEKYPDDFDNEESDKHPGKCVTIWEPFEKYGAEKIARYIKGEGLWT